MSFNPDKSHILTNSLSKRTVWQTLLSTFLTVLLRKFSHSNFWAPLSATMFLAKSWPTKPVEDWAIFVMWCNSLAHPNSYLPTRPLSAGWWSTALPSGLVPLLPTLLCLMPWKPRPSRSLKPPMIKLNICADHLPIAAGRSSVFYHLIFRLAPFPCFVPRRFLQHPPSGETPKI